jgi:tetratricopeptide (TPR) repeat protein
LNATALARGDIGEQLRARLSNVFDRLSTHTSRDRLLADLPELVRAEAVVVLSEWVPRLIRTEVSKAPFVADLAHLIARRLKDPESLALALRAKGNLFHVSGRNRAAVRCHDRARLLFTRSGNRTQLARTLSASIQPLILLGEYDRAFAAAHEASAIFKDEGNEWRLARVELNTGNIFDRQDRFSEALDYYERSYRHLWVHREQDPDGVATVLHNMAGCLVCLNDFHRALRTYEEARNFAVQHKMPVLVAQADYNIAWLHYLRGEYSRAIALLRVARDACQQSGDHYHFALSHLDLSEIYLELNMGAEAEEAAAIAQTAFHRLGMKYEEGKSTTNLAIALSQQGKTPRAVTFFESARVLFLNEGNQIWSSLLDLYEAIALLKQDDDAHAKYLASAALRVFKKHGHSSKVVLCHLLLSRVAKRRQDLGSALRHCFRALIFLRSIESPALSCQAHALMAQVRKSLGQPERAFEHLQSAKEYLEELRGGIRNDELKISFMRDRVEIYEGLVDLCLSRDGNHAREALEYVEQAKSRSLFDLVTTSRSPAHEPIPEESSSSHRIRELRRELNWYQHRIEIEQLRSRVQGGQQLCQLREEAGKREHELLRLLREHPAFDAEASFSDTSRHMSVEHIQESLSREATIVEYFQTADRLIAIVLTSGHLEMVPLGKMGVAEDLLRRLRFQMAKPRLGLDYVAAFEGALLGAIQSCLHELYTELVSPICSRLRTGNIVVVPHGILHHLPFHALFDGEHYLCDDFAVSYAPSASLYTFCDARPANESGPAWVFGIPEAKIPAVEAEAAAVAQALPEAHLAVGASATSALLAQKGAESRFIHVATHGYFREDQPMFSGVRMADSCLSLYDLYQLSLPAELVTLSGCSTGLNVVSAGDEILGLARGLICAGAQSALLTLWDVHDQSTAEFMRIFYKSLASHRNKAAAVRDAALELRKSHPLPYYWAPFTLVGKTFRN